MENQIQSIACQLKCFFAETPYAVLKRSNIKKLSKLTQQNNKKTKSQVRQARKEIYYEQILFKAATKVLLRYNRLRVDQMEVHEAKRKFVKYYRMNQISGQRDKISDLKWKQKLASYFLSDDLTFLKKSSRSYQFQVMKIKNLMDAVIREVEEYVNFRCFQEQKTRQIPKALIHFAYLSFAHYQSTFSGSNAQTFELFLKAVCIIEDVEITHESAISLYEAILDQLEKFISQNWKITSKSKKKSSISRRLKKQSELNRWNSVNDRLLIEIFVKGMSMPLELAVKKALSLPPTWYLTEKYLKSRVKLILINELKRLKTEIFLKDPFVEVKDYRYEALMRQPDSEELKILLARSYLMGQPDNEMVSSIFRIYKDYFSRKRKEVLAQKEDMKKNNLNQSTTEEEEVLLDIDLEELQGFDQ